MQEVSPQVFLIGSTNVNRAAMRQYLDLRDGTEWLDRMEAEGQDDATTLSEFEGRLCYRAWKPGLNPNVTRVREDSAAYIENVLSQAHGSIFEHSFYNFVFADVSRVFTHELITHRVGMAKSQESLRYVRLTDLKFWLPECLDEMAYRFMHVVEEVEEFQREASEYYGLDDPDKPFAEKKELTSALRRLIPMGVATDIGWSANLRTIRHCIDIRTAPGAEIEIRNVFREVYYIMREVAPTIFADFTEEPNGHCKPKYEKV